ncbi:unnamed protein product, partial [Anisakis simplex]|uniref:Zinc finger with UFM1-specific peptidase domain protein (inferred by orthology to a human protein) n=1 Tax=Anisakis simplex TaxID=6269 RepID=A0A0M3JAQ8_ANISI
MWIVGSGLDQNTARAWPNKELPAGCVFQADEAPSASRELSERISMLLDSQRDIRRVCIAKYLRLFEIQKEDTGYGCGYRNLQTIIASIVNDRELRCAGGITEVLTSIQQIQEGIELAWMVGFDPVGASNLDFHLKGTRKWIGATEIAAFLQYHRIRVQLVDVRLLLNRIQKQRQIVEWVWRYFNSDGPQIPLYFQHQGHSRVIIGCIESSNTSTGKELLIYDP